MISNFKPNKTDNFLHLISTDIEWVKENTAILIIHGVGDQLPLETVDKFGRGLIKQYKSVFEDDLVLSHEIVEKRTNDNRAWFDNILRIKKNGSEAFIDIYEYYWANYTQDKASWKDLNTWLQGVVNGAKTFYKRNGQLGQQYKDKSIFFDSKTGKFKPGKYRFVLATISKIFFFINAMWRGIIWLISLIPFFGKFADSLLESFKDTVIYELTNVIGDVVTYNINDPKSKFYEVHKTILNNAVESIKFLIEKLENPESKVAELKSYSDQRIAKEKLYYPSVIVAGHSLGSQVGYDAINKINFFINENQIATYSHDGKCIVGNHEDVSLQLKGFITFGCPLDKIVFFLRQNVTDDQYLMQQFLDEFHIFKMRDLNSQFNNRETNKLYVTVSCLLKPLFQNIKWRNYYDNKDYVSGSLDYYEKLINIDCKFTAGKFGFTHSYYWKDDRFFKDIIINFLN